jgi:hypothetical protein
MGMIHTGFLLRFYPVIFLGLAFFFGILTQKEDAMFHRWLVVVLVVMGITAWGSVAVADYKDFVDSDKVEAAQDKCEKAVTTCTGKCKKSGDVDCLTKCWAKTGMCVQKAINSGVMAGKMPKKAKKIVKSLTKKRTKGLKSCGKKTEKCGKKCKGEAKCFHKCSMAWLDCANAVQAKTKFNNKKLVSALKGKKP